MFVLARLDTNTMRQGLYSNTLLHVRHVKVTSRFDSNTLLHARDVKVCTHKPSYINGYYVAYL